MKTSGEVMIGNFAIARGLVEAGLELAAAYPGTPSSEILPGIMEFTRREKRGIYAEWSTNEKCAFEVAFGAAAAGKKAACMMKQVGLNVAFSSLLSARTKPIEGALVIVSCDDPGPQSSQTEQDTRLLAELFGIHLFDPASPKEACDVAYYALKYSFEKKIPVIIRSTHRVSHARQVVSTLPDDTREPVIDEGIRLAGGSRLGIVASGMTASIALDVVSALPNRDGVSLYKTVRIVPPDPGLFTFAESMEKILVLEETDQVLESILGIGSKVLGRADGFVPSAGELTYDVVREVIERALVETGMGRGRFAPDARIEETLKSVAVAPRPPRLCAGCSHRASFYAMQKASPKAIFPGDIGCYTLGISMGSVDTCLDMGSSVTFASGFYEAFNQDGVEMPIIASIGDSTFFHSGLSSLYDAVRKGDRFLLMLLDNGTTAMTGMQPTPQSGMTAQGQFIRAMPIEDVLKGFGIDYVKTLDPYDVPATMGAITDALAYLREEGAKPAVIVARRACLLSTKGRARDAQPRGVVGDDCTGCKRCVTLFDCPAMTFDEEAARIVVDKALCTECGVCLFACPQKKEGKELLSLKKRRSAKSKAQAV